MDKYIDADALFDEAEHLACYDNRDKDAFKDLLLSMPVADVEPVKKWISCSEMLPEDGEKVLIYWERLDRKTNTVYGFIDILYQTSERGWYCEGRGELNWNAIAWMPLPPVPVL